MIGSNQDQWQTLQVVPNDTTSVTVMNLIPDQVYQFMIMARNKYGKNYFSAQVKDSTKGRKTVYCSAKCLGGGGAYQSFLCFLW